MRPAPESFGGRLRILRRARDLTQDALAARSGISRTTIGALETAAYPLPQIPTVWALARGLGVAPSLLLPDPPQGPPDCVPGDGTP